MPSPSPKSRRGLVLGIAESEPHGTVIQAAQRAEALGYDTLWVGETWGRDAFTALTQLAVHTSRIRLGTGIVNVFSRTPALMAQTIATLDEISGGRAILGLGVSSRTIVERFHGLTYRRTIERTRELVEITRRILAGGRVDYAGDVFEVRGMSLPFEPLRREVPIFLASLGPRNLELAGEIADGWMPSYVDPEYIPQFRAHLRTGAERAGRDVHDFEWAPWMVACASRDAQLARDLAREHLAFFVAAYGDAYYALVCRYGFVEEAERLRELWRTDREKLTTGVSDAMLERLAIAGSPAQCREGFERLEALGADTPAVMTPSRAPVSVVFETIEALAP